MGYPWVYLYKTAEWP